MSGSGPIVRTFRYSMPSCETPSLRIRVRHTLFPLYSWLIPDNVTGLAAIPAALVLEAPGRICLSEVAHLVRSGNAAESFPGPLDESGNVGRRVATQVIVEATRDQAQAVSPESGQTLVG